jgi:uncharacterized protein YecE (DUF72 family)
VPTLLPFDVEDGRVHRRWGTQRLLAADELKDWAQRIQTLLSSSSSEKPVVYFLWGTDHERQPLENAANLVKALKTAGSDGKAPA